MGLLEQVQQMKMQGMTEDQIAGELQQGGVSPREIQDALNQSQIKNAVDMDYDSPAPEGDYSGEENYSPQENYGGMPQENYPQEQGYDQGYSGYENTGGVDTGNMIEVAEQVVEEKMKKTEKKINEFNEFKTLTQSKIENFETRLKRIESLIDQLQIKILDKIGNYGRDLEKTKKELSMVEDSFGKMVNKIADSSSSKKIIEKKSVSKKK